MSKQESINEVVNGDSVTEISNVVETSNGSSKKSDSVFNGIRGSIHPALFTRLTVAEQKMQITDRGILLDMALRALFNLSPIERAKAYDLAIDERAKLENKVKPTERDFNF